MALLTELQARVERLEAENTELKRRRNAADDAPQRMRGLQQSVQRAASGEYIWPR
jgi:hypothetical protein